MGRDSRSAGHPGADAAPLPSLHLEFKTSTDPVRLRLATLIQALGWPPVSGGEPQRSPHGMLAAPHLVLAPGIALNLVVLSVNLLGDALDVRG